jgi:hypothetical protein
MSDLLAVIDAAAQSQDWLILAIASVLLIVPIVLKALGKKIPLVDGIVELAVSVLKARKKAPPPVPAGELEGVAKVVPIEGEKPKPVEELK